MLQNADIYTTVAIESLIVGVTLWHSSKRRMQSLFAAHILVSQLGRLFVKHRTAHEIWTLAMQILLGVVWWCKHYIIYPVYYGICLFTITAAIGAVYLYVSKNLSTRTAKDIQAMLSQVSDTVGLMWTVALVVFELCFTLDPSGTP